MSDRTSEQRVIELRALARAAAGAKQHDKAIGYYRLAADAAMSVVRDCMTDIEMVAYAATREAEERAKAATNAVPAP